MKKIKLIDKIKSRRPHISKKDINDIIDDTFYFIAECCKEDDYYTQNNFGRFEKRRRAKRKGRNKSTGEIIDIPEADIIKYSISKTLFKDMNNIEDE